MLAEVNTALFAIPTATITENNEIVFATATVILERVKYCIGSTVIHGESAPHGEVGSQNKYSSKRKEFRRVS